MVSGLPAAEVATAGANAESSAAFATSFHHGCFSSLAPAWVQLQQSICLPVCVRIHIAPLLQSWRKGQICHKGQVVQCFGLIIAFVC